MGKNIDAIKLTFDRCIEWGWRFFFAVMLAFLGVVGLIAMIFDRVSNIAILAVVIFFAGSSLILGCIFSTNPESTTGKKAERS